MDQFELSPILKHVKPKAILVSDLLNNNKQSLLSIDDTLNYCIEHFVKKTEEADSVHYKIERIVFDDDSNCFCNWQLESVNGKPYAVCIAIASNKEKHIIAKKLIDD